MNTFLGVIFDVHYDSGSVSLRRLTSGAILQSPSLVWDSGMSLGVWHESGSLPRVAESGMSLIMWIMWQESGSLA